MWFEDKEISLAKIYGRRNRRKPVLEVNSRLGFRLKANAQRIAVFAVVPLVLLSLLAVLGWLGWRELFSRNERFTVRKVEIEGCRAINPEVIREKIPEGVNMFGINIAGVRKNLIEKAPTVKDVEIHRKFPGTIKVSVIERMPVVRIADSRNMVADKDGFLFAVRSGLADLPVLWGCGEKTSAGTRLAGTALSALDLLEYCRDNLKDDLVVRSVNIERSDYFVLELGDQRPVRFAWKRMKERSAASHASLVKQLECVAKALKTREAAAGGLIDATIDGQIHVQKSP